MTYEEKKAIEILKNREYYFEDLTTVYLNGFYDGEKKVKDKIKAKIDEVDKDENASIPDFIEYAKEYATQKLQSLLEKE